MIGVEVGLNGRVVEARFWDEEKMGRKAVTVRRKVGRARMF